MDLLASYDDENTGDNSLSDSPKLKEGKTKSNLAPNVLENEWLSFEQMIAPGGVVGNSEPVKSSDFLVNGIVAYPGMKGSSTGTAESGLALEEQSSASNDNETEADKMAQMKPVGTGVEEAEIKGDEDDDAFFRLRKQVKERDRSSSSDRSGSAGSSSASSSRSGSPSPPHLSPVNSIKSHTSEPPDLTERDETVEKTNGGKIDIQLKEKKDESNVKPSDEKKRTRSKDRKRSRSRSRKRSHREHRSKHDHSSSKSKRRRSRSRSKERKRRRSRDRHRHKDKKSRERKSSRGDEKRSKSRERKDSKSERQKSEDRPRKQSTSENKVSETEAKVDGKKLETKDSKDSKSESHRKRSRSRSKDRRDKKKDRKRSRSRHRHRSRSKERGNKERKRSRSKERRRSRSKDRKRKHRSRSRDRRSRSRHRSRDRHSRSRSRERLRSRSPVLGRKLTFKEQMRKEFINASKEMSQEHKGVSDLDALRKPGEALRPSDLLKGVKLSSGESVTPQMALIQTMAAMHKKAQELTGVEVPKYYNPAAVNPLKYAEQVQKRKLLWSKKTEEKDKNDQMETQWKSAFVATEDNKTATKFRKLMGMKEGEGQTSSEEMAEDVQKLSEEQQRKQAELFQRLDQEYQFARMTTHTQRGVGLGFSTTIIDPNHPQNPP